DSGTSGHHGAHGAPHEPSGMGTQLHSCQVSDEGVSSGLGAAASTPAHAPWGSQVGALLSCPPAVLEPAPTPGKAPPVPVGGVSHGSASPSPEEQRVLERKLKKERKKEARRRLREAGIAAAPSPAVKRSGAALALEYLCSWAQKREDWRFQKTRQTWLLLHMYDRDQVPDEHFPALLAYLEGLRGRARELTVQKAEALMRELDEAGAGALPPGGTQRARQVLQLLS
ncbi:PREDICTED: uncharacterized protein C7orf50 homolog, partial [Bison bison bison]|uniref:Uncharacterized protein C7orf50 homolog n=1 Tax=Bison bison bison TaxID=43346 RepID=A0A6P3IAZ1_BISBB